MTAPRPTPDQPAEPPHPETRHGQTHIGHAEHPDPLLMTPGEKLAAEWEARHDVRARGSHGSPAAVQEYFSHARSEQRRHPAPGHEQHPATGTPQPEPAPAGAPARRSWFRWLPLRRRHR